jgi:hypothetical protein
LCLKRKKAETEKTQGKPNSAKETVKTLGLSLSRSSHKNALPATHGIFSDGQEKARLSALRALLNPVELWYTLNQAIDHRLAVHKATVTFSKCPAQKVSSIF